MDSTAIRAFQMASNGIQMLIFKKDGTMVPEKLFHPGPVKGWRRR
jgi:hypothetical protein